MTNVFITKIFLVWEFVEEGSIYIVSKYPPEKYLFTTKRESNFRVEKSDRHYHNQAIKVSTALLLSNHEVTR